MLQVCGPIFRLPLSEFAHDGSAFRGICQIGNWDIAGADAAMAGIVSWDGEFGFAFAEAAIDIAIRMHSIRTDDDSHHSIRLEVQWRTPYIVIVAVSRVCLSLHSLMKEQRR